MQAPGRRAHVLGAQRLVEHTELEAQSNRVGRQDACLAACFKKSLQALVAKAFDQGVGSIV